MIYGSVCSGIEAATVAWHPLGWTPAWFSEIAPFPCKLLKYRYPDVPNLGDMLKIEHNETFQKTAIDLLVGGTPCQSFSTAGLRGGLADARGNLALEFCRILAVKRPRWFVWENVPGVLSSKGGRDFACILSGFRKCGYSFSYAILDAQHFGVPQRRRRVFVVGHLGDDWRPPAAVLFEPESLRRDTPEGRKAGKEITGTIGASVKGRQPGVTEAAGGMLASALTSRPYADNESNESKLITHTLRGTGFDASEDGTGRGVPLVTGTIDASYGRLQGCSGQDGRHGHSTLVFGNDNTSGPIYLAPALKAHPNGGRNDFASDAFVTYPYNQITSKENRSNPQPGDPSGTLSKCDPSPLLVSQQCLRRLTPLECERLQGFPDSWTAIPGAADSPRYESIGNSMAVPVVRWLGERIDKYDKIFNK